MEFKNKPGASPELHLLDMDGQLVEVCHAAGYFYLFFFSCHSNMICEGAAEHFEKRCEDRNEINFTKV